MKVRIKFRKQGAMKFIGHLDLMRYFQKVMRRAGVDIRYSEGFSPHQVMSFAAPLGVGSTSNGEYLDIEVLSTEDSKTMVSRLNAAMAEGVEILSYRKLEDSCKKAMSAVAAADYLLVFREGKAPETMDRETFFQKMEEFYRQEQIMATRQTKKGAKEFDLKPLIFELRPEGEGVFMKISTGSVENVKPELVMETFYRYMGLAYPPFAMQIEREEVYGEAGIEGEKRFVPLEAFGTEIE